MSERTIIFGDDDRGFSIRWNDQNIVIYYLYSEKEPSDEDPDFITSKKPSLSVEKAVRENHEQVPHYDPDHELPYL